MADVNLMVMSAILICHHYNNVESDLGESTINHAL